MTKLWIRLVVLVLLIPQLVLAGTYRETRPEAIEAIRSQGPGAVFRVQWAEDGSIRRIRIDSYETDQATGELIVQFSRADNVIIVEFEDSKITFEPDSEEVITPGDAGNRSSGVSLDAGLESAVMATARFIVANSKEAKAIDRAYAHIEKLQKEMDEMWQSVTRAEVDLIDEIINVDLKVKADSRDFDDFVSKIKAPDKSKIHAFAKRSHQELANIQFLSSDENFLAEAKTIRNKLLSAKIDSAMKRQFYNIGQQSLIQADRAQYLKQREEARFLLDIAHTAADVLIGADPFTGVARSIYEVFTGQNLITGVELSAGERIIAGLGLITAGYALTATRAFKAMLPIVRKVGAASLEKFYALRTFLNKTGNGFELVGQGSEVRKINLRSKLDSKWGLNPRHLNRRFFGNGELALRKIDPAGNPDTWMQNIMDVVQRPVTSVTRDGKLDIVHKYIKADGSGMYDLGVRLHKNGDGTYDVVTILTRQGVN